MPEPEPLENKAFELDPQVSAEEGSAFWYKDVKSAAEWLLGLIDATRLDRNSKAIIKKWIKKAFADVFTEKERG